MGTCEQQFDYCNVKARNSESRYKAAAAAKAAMAMMMTKCEDAYEMCQEKEMMADAFSSKGSSGQQMKSLAMGVAVSKKVASMQERQANEKSLAVGVSVPKKA